MFRPDLMVCAENWAVFGKNIEAIVSPFQNVSCASLRHTESSLNLAAFLNATFGLLNAMFGLFRVHLLSLCGPSQTMSPLSADSVGLSLTPDIL